MPLRTTRQLGSQFYKGVKFLLCWWREGKMSYLREHRRAGEFCHHVVTAYSVLSFWKPVGAYQTFLPYYSVSMSMTRRQWHHPSHQARASVEGCFWWIRSTYFVVYWEKRFLGCIYLWSFLASSFWPLAPAIRQCIPGASLFQSIKRRIFGGIAPVNVFPISFFSPELRRKTHIMQRVLF